MDRNVYQDLIENLPVAALFIIDGRIVLNKKARTLTGFEQSDFTTLDDWFNITFLAEAKVAKEAYLRAKKDNFPQPFRVQFVKKNGEKIITDLTGSMSNELETWLIEDLTESLLLQERYSVLFNHSTDAHFLLGDDGIIDCNWAAVKILNARSKEDLLGIHPAIFSPVYQPDGMFSANKKKLMMDIALRDGFNRFEWVHKKMTGEVFFVEVTLNQVRVAGKQVFLIVWHDLTAIKEAQRKLEEERGNSFHAAKMATLGEMASGIAHEINNPLTVILNRAIQIKNQVHQGEAGINTAASHAEKIVTIVNRISKIVRGLRNFARDGANDNFEFQNVKTIIEETLDMCQARFQKHDVVLWQSISCPSIWDLEFYCVPVQIQQVLINLLNNAFDAVVDLKPNWIELRIHADPQHLWISVLDSGPGIPHHLKDKIMQPFFTTKEIGKGTGLGLSISQGIVEAHKGEFYLDNKSEHTKFVVKLPITSPAGS